jgi:hypothetical protein
MSKVIGSPSMYSGRENPQRELTDEEIVKIKDLISQLTIVSAAHNPTLGFNGYGVGNEDWYISGSFYGQVLVFEDNSLTAYKDTVGVTAYLHLILGHLVREHLEEHEKVLGATQ